MLIVALVSGLEKDREHLVELISKADDLAAIDRGSADSLVESFEKSLNTELDENYNAVRWGRDY